jgi:hypothetical protein
MNFIPNTWTGFIHVALLGCGTSTRTVAHPFGTLHGTDECGFLQKTVSTHSATKHWAFDPSLNFSQHSFSKGFLFKWKEGGLPSSAWSK